MKPTTRNIIRMLVIPRRRTMIAVLTIFPKANKKEDSKKRAVIPTTVIRVVCGELVPMKKTQMYQPSVGMNIAIASF